ncbi:MAG TPA: hypothetical protein VIC30_10005, partial [Orrella sp.]
TADGGVDEDVTSTAHPDNLRLAVDAARAIGLSVAGVDIMSVDLSEPWHSNHAVVNEVNFSPLLGGGEISRSYLPQFFSRFVPDNGQIPLYHCSSREQALQTMQACLADGVKCFCTADSYTLDDQFNVLPMTENTLNRRLKALCMRSDVQAIAVIDPGGRPEVRPDT